MMMSDIIAKRESLDKRLKQALATMARKDDIYQIKKELLEIQNACPHFDSNFNWAMIDNHCPYCGKKVY